MTTRSDSANGSGVRIIGLDTLEPGNHGGRLGATQLAWLDSTLATQTTTATAIFMHHPPFKTHMPVFDAMGCVDGDALGDVVKRHPQVQLVASGHVHRSVQTLWCGTLAIALSSATFQYPLYLQTTDQALRPDFITGVVGLSVWSSDGQVVAHEKLIAPE
jgi:3',5'-cyclic AMP phosphodiesterase CpdA